MVWAWPVPVMAVTLTTSPAISAAYPAQFPFYAEIAGEVVNVTAITGTGLAQTMTVTRGVHGVAKTLPAGSPVQLWRAPVVAL